MNSTSVVPRSRPSMTMTARIAVPGMSGISICRHSMRPWRTRLDSRSAPHSTSPSLAGSDGCTVNGPM